MLYWDTQQNIIEESPRTDPCEKSRPPTVMIKNTPVDAIIRTKTLLSMRLKLLAAMIFPPVRIEKINTMATKPKSGPKFLRTVFMFQSCPIFAGTAFVVLDLVILPFLP